MGRRGCGPCQVDAAGAGGAEPGGQRQLVEEAIGDEADVSAVQDGGEPVVDAGQPGDDLGEVIQSAAAAHLFAVVDGGKAPTNSRAKNTPPRKPIRHVHDLEKTSLIPRANITRAAI